MEHRAIRSTLTLVDAERSLRVLLRQLVPARKPMSERQVESGRRHLAMRWAKHVLPQGQRTLEERAAFGKLAGAQTEIAAGSEQGGFLCCGRGRIVGPWQRGAASAAGIGHFALPLQFPYQNNRAPQRCFVPLRQSGQASRKQDEDRKFPRHMPSQKNRRARGGEVRTVMRAACSPERKPPSTMGSMAALQGLLAHQLRG